MRPHRHAYKYNTTQHERETHLTRIDPVVRLTHAQCRAKVVEAGGAGVKQTSCGGILERGKVRWGRRRRRLRAVPNGEPKPRGGGGAGIREVRAHMSGHTRPQVASDMHADGKSSPYEGNAASSHTCPACRSRRWRRWCRSGPGCPRARSPPRCTCCLQRRTPACSRSSLPDGTGTPWSSRGCTNRCGGVVREQPTRGAHTSSTQQEDPLFRPYTNRSVSSHSHP
jgi:hypothetical protein